MHGDHLGGEHRLDLVARLDPLTTESMKFAPRSNGPLSWEALTKWEIIAAIATPTRSAMRSLAQVSHLQWRNAPRNYRRRLRTRPRRGARRSGIFR
jgi:hypothetical protein